MTPAQRGQILWYDLTPEISALLKMNNSYWLQTLVIMLSSIIMAIVWALVFKAFSVAQLMSVNTRFYPAVLTLATMASLTAAIAVYSVYCWANDSCVCRRVVRVLKREALAERIAEDLALPVEAVIEAFVTYVINGDLTRSRERASSGIDLSIYTDEDGGRCYLGVSRIEKVRIVELASDAE